MKFAITVSRSAREKSCRKCCTAESALSVYRTFCITQETLKVAAEMSLSAFLSSDVIVLTQYGRQQSSGQHHLPALLWASGHFLAHV